jgi:hypothetical protein
MREAVAMMKKPCPCPEFADSGAGDYYCACGHVDDKHYEDGKGACTVNHRDDCALNHGTGPCLIPPA